MSAEILRRAASLMRERAGRVELSAKITASTAASAENVRSWHPGVAMAVADWLDVFANYDETGENASDETAAALRVARAYLGESA